MSDWMPIESAPKDGTLVVAKRVYEGRVVAEGPALWATLAPEAPMRQPMDRDPIGRMSEAQYAAEKAGMVTIADRPRWLRAGRLYAFPEPTHWKPFR